MRKRVIHVDIVYIKCVLRQFELTELEHFRAVDNRMHQDVLIKAEMSDVIPSENLVLRKNIVIPDDFFVLHPDFFIYVVGDDHIYFGVVFHKSSDCFENLKEGILIYPVIAVYDFKIFSGRVTQTTVNSIAMPAVFFADGFDNGRIFFLITLGDCLSAVFGSVIDNDDLDIFAAGENRVDRFFHISF